MMTIHELEQQVMASKVHQIRCGNHRFIDITIVATEGRFFVRQYKFGKKSWRDAFLVHPDGAMKISDDIIDIQGIVPADLEQINPQVNKAYRTLLWLMYPAMRLTFDTDKHEASTMELIPVWL